jgi:putative oxidoreductase
MAAVALAAVGPGAWSLDHALGLGLSGGLWAGIALVAGVGAGGAILASSYRPRQQ